MTTYWTAPVPVFQTAAALLLTLTSARPAEPPPYDPSGQVRFSTPQQAEAKRQELIHFIWEDGLPTNRFPAVTANVGAAVFAGDLAGLSNAPAASVDRLDADVEPYAFHAALYLIHPLETNANYQRLVIYHSGHRRQLTDWAGGDDVIQRALAAGFRVLVMDMPCVGFNTDNTFRLPGGETVAIAGRGSAAHREMFARLLPSLTNGTIFRFFLEPVVQGVNHFLKVTGSPAADVTMIGLSGGGWTTTMVPAVDVRIRRSFPVAGSYPLYCRTNPFPSFSHDIEQYYEPLYRETDSNGDGIADTAAGVASWLEIYALGAFGPGRRQTQILNYYDECCFFGDAYKTYADFLARRVRGLGQGEWTVHSDTTHKRHCISSDVITNVILPALAGGGDGAAHRSAEARGASARAPDEIAPINAPFSMPPLRRPVFPDRTFSIVDFGAKGDGVTKGTEAFCQAIEACHAAGGGRVVVPAGRWLTGAIHLKSGVNLCLAEEAELHFSDDPQDYLPVVFTRWAGFEVMNYSPLIYANNCENIAITGPGRLYGHGKKWWEWCKRLDERDKVGPGLQAQAVIGVPPQERVFGSPALGLRPQFISPIHCRNVLLEGFTIAEPGPFWTIQFIYCENVIARGLSVHTRGGPNTDGINLDSTRNALVEHCLIDAGDDAVCLKSGINEDGRRVGRPTENVVVRHVTALSCHGGIVIGSDMSGGVRNVLASDCVYDGSDIGIRLKSNASRGGVVENVWCRNITMRDIRGDAIQVETNYRAWLASKDGTNYPVFRNLHLQGVVCDGAQAAASIRGVLQQPVRGLTLENVSLRAQAGMRFDWVHGLKLDRVTCAPSSGEPFSFQNCQDVLREPAR